MGRLLLLVVLLCSAQLVCAQDKPMADEMVTEVQWLWGEVVSVDNVKNQLVVKYLDYDADQEKEITITTDASTAFENARQLLDIKPQDTVSIDYTVNADLKNIAKNISVEKPEAEPTMPSEPVSEETPPPLPTE